MAPPKRPLHTSLTESHPPARGRTQSIYYRDSHGHEPVSEWIETLGRTRPEVAAKIEAHLAQHLNGRNSGDPPPEFPITSQIEGDLRELRVRFGNTRYRLLYQRSRNLVVILHGLEKNTGGIPREAIKTAQKHFVDFKTRMDAEPRVRPRAAGHDAPRRRGVER